MLFFVFIRCNSWYHNGCVGVQLGDPRLNDSEIFACPPCVSVHSMTFANPIYLGESSSPMKRRNSTPAETCGRPDCAFKKSTADSDEYFVKRIIGRRVKVEGGRGRVEEWLVEWDGYPIGESTWEKESSMANPTELIESFVNAAEKEGLDLDTDPNATVLLKDAKRSGFRPNER
ncbi:hypothetical protein P691DRAFT_675055 [Macrolepiota fuliginosa MF-IS2]|uniref:Chromo domain-containing protein n=1 Tax=Macrolepiota fuliginosa MF-IS2 TaxID=1400762 RepID=A0A9P5X7X9_9AGAR|nr:hypothetical protein P691DRAFT_675055 [Macrolepiota fuliginosa MF-IS2]